MIDPYLKQFLIYLGMSTDETIRTQFRQVDKTVSNISPGDMVTFEYTKTTGRGKGSSGSYTVIAVGDGNTAFKHKVTGNTLFSAYKVNGVSPETTALILASIYRGKEERTSEFNREHMEGFLKTVIGGSFGSDNYRTFNDAARGTMTKVELENIAEIADSLITEGDLA